MSETPDEFLHRIVARPFANAVPGRVGVAVSGGSDSMALLLLMAHWAREHGATLRAVTVDHGLRPEAAEEAGQVAALCKARGLAHDILRWGGWDGRGNLQAAAREARYRLIADWAGKTGVRAVCLGHTRDDQAETFLMRLARKAGSDGLRAMDEDYRRDGMRFVRPVLDVGRAELRAFLDRRGVAWVDDPSNADDSFDRVRARKAMAALAPLGIGAETLRDVALNLRSENEVLRQATVEALSGGVRAIRGALAVDPGLFQRLHPDVARRFLVAALRWIGGAGYAPRRDATLRMALDLSRGETHTLAGVIGWSGKETIWLAREPEAVKGLSGNPFDGRWMIEGDLEGREIRALGEEGLNQLPDWRDLGLPRRVLLPAPAVWQGENLVAAPLAGAENRFKVSFLRPSFDNWLQQD